MEHDELDDMFKKILENDNSELSDRELTSKENIWKAIDRPRKEVKFSLWGIAAAILLMLLIGSSYFFSKKISNQNQKYIELEQKYNNIDVDFKNLEERLARQENKREKEEKEMNSSFSTTIPKVTKRDIVYVYDTIWMEKKIITDPIKVIEKDTVYVEIPKEKTKELVQSKTEQPEKTKPKQKRKKPSKVEFVFDQKKRIKPAQKNRLIRFNESEVAKKSDALNHGVITIPIKN